MTTREKIKAFNESFGRPWNVNVVDLTVSDRLLLAKLLLEETLETITLGLGIDLKLVSHDPTDPNEYTADGDMLPDRLYDNDSDSLYSLDLVHNEGRFYDVVETADGLSDVNVVIHFAAGWAGMNLDKLTSHINDSNMSKLAVDGTPIINGITPGYRDECSDGPDVSEAGYDPSKPHGKILKGPNFWDAKPLILSILEEGNY